MANPSRRFELRSILDALNTYLSAKGYTGLNYSDTDQSNTAIVAPFISVSYPPSNKTQLQMGDTTQKTFNRRVSINAYMENEGRASDILDDLLEFLEEVCVNIEDNQNTFLGTLIVQDNNSIQGEVIPPIMNVPLQIRWRGVAQARYEAFYP